MAFHDRHYNGFEFGQWIDFIGNFGANGDNGNQPFVMCYGQTDRQQYIDCISDCFDLCTVFVFGGFLGHRQMLTSLLQIFIQK